ncbi:protein ATP6V1FNB [Synchiropus splendidus]|uniref:protein ATP6V1FNB n=1 Tax=Synchiropus splendidus TaxID=270530 RepID=UPI00237E49FF|nr:protein ATP6V1FNB [Synchiropus splendidus]
MRGLLTTRSQNAYREQIKKETLTRLAWKDRYAELYPTCCSRYRPPKEAPVEPRTATLPPIVRPPEAQSDHPPAAAPPTEEKMQLHVPPVMRPASPTTRQSLFQDSSGQGKGRSRYLQRRNQLPPEEKFHFPLLSSWDYGWRLGDYTLAYRPPSCPRSSVVKNTFYSRNGVFNS